MVSDEVELRLEPLPYTIAFEIIHYCFEHNIDREHCLRMIEATSEKPCPKIEWKVTIPESLFSYFVLKYSI